MLTEQLRGGVLGKADQQAPDMSHQVEDGFDDEYKEAMQGSQGSHKQAVVQWESLNLEMVSPKLENLHQSPPTYEAGEIRSDKELR